MSQLKHIFNELDYELVRVIAKEGMGIVYEGEQKGADVFVKRVTVKLSPEDDSNIDEFRGNFMGGARLVADLIHKSRKDRVGLVHSIRLEAWAHKVSNKHKNKRSR